MAVKSFIGLAAVGASVIKLFGQVIDIVVLLARVFDTARHFLL
jgi:hypothetical protein